MYMMKSEQKLINKETDCLKEQSDYFVIITAGYFSIFKHLNKMGKFNAKYKERILILILINYEYGFFNTRKYPNSD